MSPGAWDPPDGSDKPARWPPPAVRASDAEREATAQLLRRHAADGRLDGDELETRLEAAYSARTRGDLDALAYDLPALPGTPEPRVPAPRRAPPPDVRHAIGRAVSVSVACTLIWVFTGTEGDFWPRWVFLAMAVFVILRIGAAWGRGDDERRRGGSDRRR